MQCSARCFQHLPRADLPKDEVVETICISAAHQDHLQIALGIAGAHCTPEQPIPDMRARARVRCHVVEPKDLLWSAGREPPVACKAEGFGGLWNIHIIYIYICIYVCGHLSSELEASVCVKMFVPCGCKS